MKTAEAISATALPLPASHSVESSYDFCRTIAHRYGSNFSVGFRFLPPAKRKAVYASYAACRWADDIADEPGQHIAERLSAWEGEIGRCYEGKPAHPITIALADALQHFDIPRQAFLALIAGCRQDMEKHRYATLEELLGYCDLVATSISDISLSIYGYHGTDAPELGRNLAIALQLTNVTRDIGDDLTRDRIYLPQSELLSFGVTEDDLRSKRRAPAVESLILFQVRRAKELFRLAAPLLDRLSFDARFPTTLMGAVYAAVLREISKDPFATLERRLSLTRAQKIGVVFRGIITRSFL
jgi:phytoene synthase